nr:hypothetical protein [Tanacetum cinerariifolium]
MVQLSVCTSDGASDYKDHAQLLKLMQFVMGLDDVYTPIRSTNLTTGPLHTVKQAFSLLLRDASHWTMHYRGSKGKGNTIAFSSRRVDNRGISTSFVPRSLNAPGGRRRSKYSNVQQNDDQHHEVVGELKKASYGGNQMSPKSESSRSCLSGYSDHPNYMMHTQSSRANVRSLSAPGGRRRSKYSNVHQNDDQHHEVVGNRRRLVTEEQCLVKWLWCLNFLKKLIKGQEDESHDLEYSTFNFFRKLKAHEPTSCIELGLCLLSISLDNSCTITTLRDTVPP